jgi:hypothetical protein
MTNDSTPRPTPEADLGNRLAAANWHLVKLVVGALVRSAHPQPRAFTVEATELSFPKIQ